MNIFFLVFCLLASPMVLAKEIKVFWKGSGLDKQLRTWTPKRLAKLRHRTLRERDPISQSVESWSGVSLTAVIEGSLSELDLDESASVDLVVLKNVLGRQAAIPRAVVTKYPVVLATKRGGKKLGARGPYYSVVPWTSNKQIVSDQLPLGKYFVPAVSEMVLTNFEKHYSAQIFLKRRTDPVAIRGEKRFVRACLGCHSMQGFPSFADLSANIHRRSLLYAIHSTLKSIPALTSGDLRAVKRYMQALRTENRTFAHKLGFSN